MVDATHPALEELLDPDFLAAVSRLRIVARRVPRGGRFAEQRSAALGSGIEFQDYRPYSPGDDLRGIDWNVYRRLGRVFLRQFEELEDLPIYLLPDVSRSAYHGDPPRVLGGLKTALALASLALGQHDRVAILPFSDDLSLALRPRSGKGQLFVVARALAGLQPGGTTDFARAVDRLAAHRLRRGLVVVVSDFFDPGGLAAVTDALKRVRHRLLCVQLARGSDREPELEGDVRVVDCEGGGRAEVSITPAVRASYRAAYDRFQDGFADFLRRRGAGLVRLDVDADPLPQISGLFQDGRLLA